MKTSIPHTLRLYLIRHGETEWSLSARHTGNTDILLTANGEDEARELGKHRRDIQFTHVLTCVTVAGSVHLFLICRHCFGQIFGERSAQTLAIHYSGSVNPKNADTLLKRPGVDGVLIGGDSLNAEQFLAIRHIRQLISAPCGVRVLG
jgi:bisphosphoglycerate-dependent phosphoglycerate mutase